MGWRFKVHGLTVQGSWVDGFKILGWLLQKTGLTVQMTRLTVQMRTSSAVQTFDKLSGSHYGAWHVSFFDWFLFRIEASLRLPCTFPINTKSSLLISSFSTKTYCQSATILLVRPPRSYCYNDHQHTSSVRLVYPSLIQKIGKCSFSKSLANLFFILIS